MDILIHLAGAFVFLKLQSAKPLYEIYFILKIFGRMVPMFKGLGYAIIIIASISELYYAVICGWSFLYMFAGMQEKLPWTDCNDGEEWHTPNCYSRELGAYCKQQHHNITKTWDGTWYNGSCIDMATYCIQHTYNNIQFTSGIDYGTTKNTTHFNCTALNQSVGRCKNINLRL